MVLWHLLVFLAIGALAGWVAGKIMGKNNSLLINIIVGCLGALLGGWIASLLGIGGGLIVQILIAIGGALLLLVLLNLIFKKSK